MHLTLACVLILISAFLYSRELSTAAAQPVESEIEGQAAALAANHWLDLEGRRLPVFVRLERGGFVPLIPVYATALLANVQPAGSTPVRWAAVVFGVIDVLLFYALVVRCCRRAAIGFTAALVLLVTPSHAFFSTTATVDGVWQLPFVLCWAVGLSALSTPPTLRARCLLAVGTASLAISAYSQPSAALMMPMFGIISIFMFHRSKEWRLVDATIASAAFAAAMLPLALWYARYPTTYPDTFGRWVLHPAHLRNPVDWWGAVANWGRISTVANLFSDFFSPSHLFVTPGAPALAGMFLLPTVVPIAAGLHRLLRPGGHERDVVQVLSPAIVGACIVGPLAAAMFGQARSDERALVIVPFGLVLAVAGCLRFWWGGRTVGRVMLVTLLLVAAIQAMFYFSNNHSV